MNSELRRYTRKNLRQSRLSRIIQNLTITNWIIIINVAVFLAFYIFLLFKIDITSYLAIQPSFIIHGKYLWTIVTSMFTHIYFSHLVVNMLSLLFIGNFVEKIIGRKRFLAFYLISGILASLFFVILGVLFSQDVPAVGASGAIFGLGGLLMILTPKLPVLVFFIIPMPMWLAMIFLLGILWLVSFAFSIPIGNSAHLGGLLAGIIYGLYLRYKYKRKVKLLNRMLG